jgi:MarR family transcriptional regulator for hemolysin
VVLTDTGRQLYGTVKKEADSFRAELLANLGKDKILAVTEILEALQDAANAMT